MIWCKTYIMNCCGRWHSFGRKTQHFKETSPSLLPIKYASAPTKKGWIMVKVWSMNKKTTRLPLILCLSLLGGAFAYVYPYVHVLTYKRRNTYTDVVMYSMMVTFWWIKNLQCTTSIYLESVVNMSLAWTWPIRKPTG